MRRRQSLFRPSHWLATARRVPELYKYLSYRLGRGSYSDYYAAIMKRKAKGAMARTVGGRFSEIGRRQCEFIRSHGLRPHHSLLEFGCGPLRAGLHFVEFVEPTNYWGVDISFEWLEAGRKLLSERGLESKRPTLRGIADLSFDWAEGRTFDFVIALKVLNHMPLEDVEAFLRNARKVMTAESVLIASFIDGAVADPRGGRFHHRREALEALAETHGYRTEIVAGFCKGCRLERADRIPSGHHVGHRHGTHLKLSLQPTTNAPRLAAEAQRSGAP